MAQKSAGAFMESFQNRISDMYRLLDFWFMFSNKIKCPGVGRVITRWRRGTIMRTTAGPGATWWTISGTSTFFTPIHKESRLMFSFPSLNKMFISVTGMGFSRSPVRWTPPRRACWGWPWWGWGATCGGHVIWTRGTRYLSHPSPVSCWRGGRSWQVTRWWDNTQTPRIDS